jgi:undecaprenyl-diphosphatase
MGAFLEAVTTWDASVITAIYENVHSAFLTMFFRIVTLLGEGGIFWIAVAVILLFFKKTRRSGICIGASLLIGVIVGNGIIKNVVARPRPYDAIEGIESVVSHLSDYSFPSGHSLCCFEAATALAMNRTKWAIPAYVGAVLVAVSRLFLFVHYPTDVICGALLGVLFGVLGSLAAGAIYDRVCANIAASKKTPA